MTDYQKSQIASLKFQRVQRLDRLLDQMRAQEKTVGYDVAVRSYAKAVGEIVRWYELELERIKGSDLDMYMCPADPTSYLR